MTVEHAHDANAARRSRRVRIEDGTRGGHLLAVASVIAVVVGAVGLLTWQWFPGPSNVMTSIEGELVDVPRAVVLTGLLLVAVLSALITWHAAGARTIRPAVALAVVAVVGTACALLLLSWSISLRQQVANTPSLGGSARAAAHRLARVGALAIASSVAVPFLALWRGQRGRAIAAVAAAMGPAFVAIGYASEAGVGVAISAPEPSANSAGATTFLTGFVDAGGWFTATAVGLTAALAMGVIGVVAVFGVREFTDRKGAVAARAVRLGVPISRPVVIGMGCMLAVLFVLGRLGAIPGVKGSMPALSKSGVDPWLLAVALAACALIVIRRSERRPVKERGLTVPLLVAGGALVSGQLVAALAGGLLVLSQPVLDSAGWRDWLVNDLGGWAVWLQVWSSIFVPVGAAIWALWLRRQGERSDRTVFLFAVATMALLPGIQTVLIHRHIDTFLTDFTVATADQVMLVCVAVTTLSMLFGRWLLSTGRVLRLQILVLLVTFVAALISSAIENRFFRFGLLLPLVLGLLRGGEETRWRPARGARLLAVTGFLLVLLTAGLINGFVGEATSARTELLVFLVLSGPLVLVEALATEPDGDRETTLVDRLIGSRVALAVPPTVAMVVAAIGLIAVVHSEPAELHRPVRVDVAVRDGWLAEQEDAEHAESVWLSGGLTVIIARSVVDDVAFCSEGASGLLATAGTGEDAGYVAGLPARRYDLGADGLLTCGESASKDGSSYVVVFHSAELNAEETAQLDAISFGVSSD